MSGPRRQRRLTPSWCCGTWLARRPPDRSASPLRGRAFGLRSGEDGFRHRVLRVEMGLVFVGGHGPYPSWWYCRHASNVGSWAWVSSTLSTATRMANGERKGRGPRRKQAGPLGVFQRLQGGTGHAGPELCQLLVAPEQVALVAAALGHRSLMPAGLGHLPGARGSGRQGGGQVMQDAHERLRVVVGVGGRLLRIGEEQRRVFRAVLPEELAGVRQLFGRGGDLGQAVEALVEGGHEGLRLGDERIGGRRRRDTRGCAGRRRGMTGGQGGHRSHRPAGGQWRGDRRPVAPGQEQGVYA